MLDQEIFVAITPVQSVISVVKWGISRGIAHNNAMVSQLKHEDHPQLTCEVDKIGQQPIMSLVRMLLMNTVGYKRK